MKKYARVIIIDAEKQEIREEVIDKSLESQQAIVGGLIERASVLQPWADDLYVDEEGLLKSYAYGFRIMINRELIMFGNGYFIGHDGKGGSCDAKVPVDEIKKRVKFFKVER